MYKVKNWEKFNLYTPKNPRHQKKMLWFKVYGTDLINDVNFFKLSHEEQALLFKFWCLASENNGNLPNTFDISFRLHYPIEFIKKMTKDLFSKGWLTECYQTATIDRVEESRVKERREDRVEESRVEDRIGLV